MIPRETRCRRIARARASSGSKHDLEIRSFVEMFAIRASPGALALRIRNSPRVVVCVRICILGSLGGLRQRGSRCIARHRAKRNDDDSRFPPFSVYLVTFSHVASNLSSLDIDSRENSCRCASTSRRLAIFATSTDTCVSRTHKYT